MILSRPTRALVVVGGLSWGLVGLARLDVVALLTRERFGGTNAATRLIYSAVGAAAVAEPLQLVKDGTSEGWTSAPPARRQLEERGNYTLRPTAGPAWAR
jgi:uncharacterized protein